MGGSQTGDIHELVVNHPIKMGVPSLKNHHHCRYSPSSMPTTEMCPRPRSLVEVVSFVALLATWGPWYRENARALSKHSVTTVGDPQVMDALLLKMIHKGWWGYPKLGPTCWSRCVHSLLVCPPLGDLCCKLMKLENLGQRLLCFLSLCFFFGTQALHRSGHCQHRTKISLHQNTPAWDILCHNI